MKSVVGIRLAHVAPLVVIGWASAASAQWTEQVLQLEVGWNAVYFELDPEPNEAAVLFKDLPIKAVWMRVDSVRTKPSVDGTLDTNGSTDVSATDTGWRVWFPSGEPQHVINSFRVVRGGRVYLIEASAPATLTIRGRPDGSIMRWREGYNLAGFHVVDDEGSTPTFAQYLRPSEAHRGGSLYEVSSDGTLVPVSDPETMRITPGKGYWVQALKNSTYDGPIRIDRSSLRGVELARGVSEHRIHIENLRSAQGNVDVSHQPVVGARELEAPGGNPLLRFGSGTAEETGAQGKWLPLNKVILPLEAAGQPGSSRTLRIAVSRQDLAGPDRGHEGDGYYNSILRVTDDTGYMRRLQVNMQRDVQDGLWVGDVTVTDVESLTAPGQGAATASPFTFRVILHKSTAATYSLLRDVVLLWDDGGGSYILVTPDCTGLLDGAAVVPRISSANFSFDSSLSLAGDFDTTLTGTIALAPSHALDPYRHIYHPEHANGFAGGITRVLTFTFDGDGGGDPEWGVTRLGGSYTEDIAGMHRDMIQVSGQFEIRKISDIASLCGQ